MNKIFKQGETLPTTEKTNNGWLSKEYSVSEEAQKFLDDGALFVTFDSEQNPSSCFAFFLRHVKVFYNDGEYVETLQSDIGDDYCICLI